MCVRERPERERPVASVITRPSVCVMCERARDLSKTYADDAAVAEGLRVQYLGVKLGGKETCV